MLTRTPTRAQIEASVHRTITEILSRKDRPVPAFANEDELVATGLKSLDLAALVAMLGREWQVDPFLRHRSITQVRTVGDLCDAYRACFEDPAGGASDPALQDAYGRAARRRG